MKRIIAVVLILCVVQFCFLSIASAATTTGPSKTVTAASSKKAKAASEPSVNVGTLTIGGGGYYIFWVRYQTNDKQVSPSYEFSTTGNKTVYYMASSRTDGYVVKDGWYDARFKSNNTVPANEQGTITVTFGS